MCLPTLDCQVFLLCDPGICQNLKCPRQRFFSNGQWQYVLNHSKEAVAGGGRMPRVGWASLAVACDGSAGGGRRVRRLRPVRPLCTSMRRWLPLYPAELAGAGSGIPVRPVLELALAGLANACAGGRVHPLRTSMRRWLSLYPAGLAGAGSGVPVRLVLELALAGFAHACAGGTE